MTASIKIPTREKLTKSLLWLVPDGAFIISNCFGRDGQPVFASQVTADADRQDIWQQILAAQANHRLCLVTFDCAAFHRLAGRGRASKLDERARQLGDIATTGGEDNAECAAADLHREAPAPL